MSGGKGSLRRSYDVKKYSDNYDKIFGKKENQLTCSCGGEGPNHILGEGKCFRKLATGNLIPKNFRKVNGIEMCDVNDDTITVYTLKQQRMYSQYETGEWSLLKDESSTNSLEVI